MPPHDVRHHFWYVRQKNGIFFCKCGINIKKESYFCDLILESRVFCDMKQLFSYQAWFVSFYLHANGSGPENIVNIFSGKTLNGTIFVERERERERERDLETRRM
jgi:hypothetical protein